MAMLKQMFVDIELHDLIIVHPWQLKNELYLHLKNNLKNKCEKKCIDIGYICKIHNITKYDEGYIVPEDLSGNITFKVQYNAKVCIPIPNTIIVMKIEQIFKRVVMVTNGPVSGIIKFSDINSILFDTNEFNEIFYKKTNIPIKIGSHVKVLIKTKRTYSGESNIGIVGAITDIATDEEAKDNMYYDIDDENDEQIIDANTNVEMNDDDIMIEGVIPIKSEKNNFVMEI
jgi:DNA-directed RNA polymerase subunit E'/Rpb7